MNRSEEVHICFSVMAAGNFPGHLKTAETRICRHSDHRGKKWQAWLAPWWQVAFRRKKCYLRQLCFCFGSFPTHPSISCCALSHLSLLACFGRRSDVSQRGAGSWFVTRTFTWYCRTVGEWVTCSKLGFSEVGVLRSVRTIPFVSVSVVGGGGRGEHRHLTLVNRWQSTVTVHFGQLFWVKRWMWRKVKMAEDRWTGQVESLWTGLPWATSLSMHYIQTCLWDLFQNVEVKLKLLPKWCIISCN